MLLGLASDLVWGLVLMTMMVLLLVLWLGVSVKLLVGGLLALTFSGFWRCCWCCVWRKNGSFAAIFSFCFFLRHPPPCAGLLFACFGYVLFLPSLGWDVRTVKS